MEPLLTVTLEYPTPFDGVLRDRLSLRAPKVRDMRSAAKQAPQDIEERELILFGLLAEVSPKELEGLHFTDYRRLQEGYFRLVSPSTAATAVAAPTDETPRPRAALPALGD